MIILEAVDNFGSKLIKNLYTGRDALGLGRYLISNLKLGTVNTYDSQTPYTIGRIFLDYASDKFSNRRVDQLATRDLILQLLKKEKDAYADSALKALGFKKNSKKKIDIKDYNPSSSLKKAVSKFIKDPFAAVIVATWYENEGASPSDISLYDTLDMLNAATDPQEIKIVKAALGEEEL